MNPMFTPASFRLARRQFLSQTACGLGAAALASLLNPRLFARETSGAAEAGRRSGAHHFPRAKRIIWLTQAGAPSQLELFDPKPELRQRFDQDLPDSIRGGQRLTGMTSGQARLPIAPSLYNFRQHGRAGM